MSDTHAQKWAWFTGWLGVLLFMGWWALLPPSPTAADAPDRVFSGERALKELQDIFPNAPHPFGSSANRDVEAALVRRLREHGLHTVIEVSSFCERSCVQVRNVVATIAGADPKLPALLVSTHYDSVEAGPGAGDDAAGVAVAVELARAWTHRSPQHPIVFLFNEGEEADLYGAKAFVRESAFNKNVGAVVNLEARGSEGPAFLFQMEGSVRGFGSAFQRFANSPSISTLYVDIYRMLPNNTDVAVYAQQGWPSANIAFLGAGHRYHTPLDDAAHLSPRSVEHLGQQAEALMRGLDGSDLSVLNEEEPAVVFDFLGWWVVHWSSWTQHGLVGGLVLGLIWVRPTLRSVGRVLFVMTVVGVGVGVADPLLFRLGPGWAVAPTIAHCAILLLVLAMWTAFAPMQDDDKRWAGVYVVYTTLALGLDIVLPGGAYLFVLAAYGAGIGHGLRSTPWSAVGCLGSLSLWSLAWGLPEAIGGFGLVFAAPLLLAGLAVYPFTPRSPTVSWVLLASSSTVLATTVVWPTATEEHPTVILVEQTTRGEQSEVRAFDVGWPRAAGPIDMDPIPGRFVEATLRPMGAGTYLLRAPGGTRARFRMQSGRVRRIGDAQVNTRHPTWTGATDELVLHLEGAGPLWVSVSRATPVPPQPHPTVAGHTGWQIWSEQTFDLTAPGSVNEPQP